MSLFLYDTENDFEVKIDYYDEITPITNRQVQKYVSYSTNRPKSLSGDPVAPEFRVSGVRTENLNYHLKKLDRLTQMGGKMLFVAPEIEIATRGYLASVPMNLNASRPDILPVEINFTCNSDFFGTAKEAEDCTVSGGPIEDDSEASGGKIAKLNSSMDYVRWTLDQNKIILPESDYIAYFRAKDTEHVSDDLSLDIYNVSDSISISQTTFTLTSSYDWYSLDFTIDSNDVSDEIKFELMKLEPFPNLISIDLICFVEDV